MVFDPERIKDLSDGLMDDIIDGPGLMVKRWARGKDQGAAHGRHFHYPDMSEMKRSFSYNENQLAFFFQRDIGGPDQKVFIIRMSNSGEGSYRTWNDDHSVRQKGTACRGGGHVLIVVTAGRQSGNFRRPESRLDFDILFPDSEMIRWVSTSISRSCSSILIP